MLCWADLDGRIGPLADISTEYVQQVRKFMLCMNSPSKSACHCPVERHAFCPANDDLLWPPRADDNNTVARDARQFPTNQPTSHPSVPLPESLIPSAGGRRGPEIFASWTCPLRLGRFRSKLPSMLGTI